MTAHAAEPAVPERGRHRDPLAIPKPETWADVMAAKSIEAKRAKHRGEAAPLRYNLLADRLGIAEEP